jgi:cytochrome c556
MPHLHLQACCAERGQPFAEVAGMRTPSLIVALSGALAVSACAGKQPRNEPPQQPQLARALAPPARLAPPEYLPETARVLLRTRMVSHARDMADLMNAIMVLDYPSIAGRAGAVADDANFARPLTGDATELNSALPEKFFQHQDELKAQARRLATAADHMKAFEVAEAYGRLSETCVRCHASYRTGQ